jgi:hypothetical protein
MDSDWLRAERPNGGSSIPGKENIFLFSMQSRKVFGPTQPPMQCVLRDYSPVVKRTELEAHQSPPTSAEMKNEWIYISTPHTLS